MDKVPELRHPRQVTRMEIFYLMNLLGAKILFGADQKETEAGLGSIIRHPDSQSIADNLVNKGVLVRQGKDGFAPSPQVKSVLDSLFFPETGLAVLLEKPGIGKQIFFVVRKEKNIVFHSSPSEGEHFIALVSNPEALEGMLADCFPVSGIPVTPVKFRIKRSAFEYIQFLTHAGKTDEARNLMERGDLDPIELENFLHAISDYKISGSIAWLFLRGDTVHEAKSIFLQTDGQTAWLASPMEADSPEEQLLYVRRTGSDFSSILRQIVEELAGIKFSRKIMGPSGKIIRFALSVDELAMSLHAINCADQSRKIYVLASGDATGDRYADTMKRAHQSLVESGLCTVTERGFPILSEDLAQAVFPIGKSDSMIKISGSMGGPALETGVYIVKGRFFTLYRNYGEQLQLLEFGKIKDLISSIELMFPDFGSEKDNTKTSISISSENLKKAMGENHDPQKASKIISLDGASAADADLFAGDLLQPTFRTSVIRRYSPDGMKINENLSGENKEEKQLNALLLLKSPLRSWIVKFYADDEMGMACTTDRTGFRKALTRLILSE
jgi:hypothetical protein